MEKIVHRIITHQSFAHGIKGGEYYYCDGVDREINQAMQEPLKKLYKYENQPDMREKVKEYMSELDTEIDRCNKEISNLSYDEVQVRANRAEINVYQCRTKTLIEVKNDLQSRLDELI